MGSEADSTAGIQESGTVYVFDGITGALRHTLFGPQPEAVSRFGAGLAVTPDGDVLVGAYGTDVDGIASVGHAYLFDGETGNLLLDIAHPEPTSLDAFGWSVAAIDGRIIIGALNANPVGSGAVYVYEGIPEPRTVVMGMVATLVATDFLSSSSEPT